MEIISLHWRQGSETPVFETIASHLMSSDDLLSSPDRPTTQYITGDYVISLFTDAVIMWNWVCSDVLIWKLEVGNSLYCRMLHPPQEFDCQLFAFSYLWGGC